jgi:uncharacterized protein with PQ loop repeat
MMDGWIEKLGLFAAVAMPVWNIPLILRIIRRRSSEDISLWWALGVWVCILLMAPSGFRSSDMVWRAFNITNMIFFTIVVIVTLTYRKREKRHHG